MVDEQELLKIAEETTEHATKAGASQALVNAFMWDRALTRYSNSMIHQNVAYKNGGLTIKVAINGNQLGTTRIYSLEKDKMLEAIKQAIKTAKVSPPNRAFKGFTKPEKWSQIKGAFDKETASATPDFRAEKVGEAIDTAHAKSKLVKAVAGYFATGAVSFAVANSNGVSAWSKTSLAYMKATVISKKNGTEGFGAEEVYSRRIRDINPEAVADVAADKSVKSVKPERVPPKEYEVVLEPTAVETILFYLGYIGFCGLRFQDGTSFVKYNLNRQVFDEKLDIKDDARDADTFYATAVDGEGTPKRAVNLVDGGVVSEESICYDSLTASREGKATTGHALPPIARFFEDAPLPINIKALPKDATLEEMIAETKHGLLITTFHYTNPVEPTKAILTGLTRDGTFLIENGEVRTAIRNLRYTDSMLSALRDILMIGKEVKTFETGAAPAMKLGKLRFVSESQH